MNDLKGVRVIATIPPGIYQHLAAMAEAEGRAVGNLAGYVLEEWVRAQLKPAPTECRFQKQPETCVHHHINHSPQVIAL